MVKISGNISNKKRDLGEKHGAPATGGKKGSGIKGFGRSNITQKGHALLRKGVYRTRVRQEARGRHCDDCYQLLVTLVDRRNPASVTEGYCQPKKKAARV